MTTTTIALTGLTCDHCVQAVTTELGTVPGVIEVQVDLVAGGTSTVQIASSEPLDPDAVAAAIDEAGYDLATP